MDSMELEGEKGLPSNPLPHFVNGKVLTSISLIHPVMLILRLRYNVNCVYWMAEYWFVVV